MLPLFHRLKNIRHQSMDLFHFPSWKTPQGPMNASPFLISPSPPHPFISWILNWFSHYLIQLPSRVEGRIFQNMQCSGIHPAFLYYHTRSLLVKTCMILTRTSRTSQPTNPSMHITNSSWIQLLQWSYSSLISFMNIFNPVSVQYEWWLREWLWITPSARLLYSGVASYVLHSLKYLQSIVVNTRLVLIGALNSPKS